MSESFVMYRSFHEALKELTREQYGNVMYAINEYALDGKLTEDLSGIEKAVFLMAKPQLDANRQRRENGAQGGRPKKETQKPEVSEIENQTKPEVSENDETEKPNVNVNVNANENVNTHTECACEPHGIGKIQKQCFEMIQEHNNNAPRERKIPCSNNLISFMQKEMRELLGAVGPADIGDQENIIATLRNFIKVAQSDTWQKTFSWRSFCKNYQNYTPAFFTLSKYLNTEPETEDATQKPEYKFYMRMRTEARFHVETFQEHIAEWKAEGRPEGAEYFRLQDEWEAKKCS